MAGDVRNKDGTVGADRIEIMPGKMALFRKSRIVVAVTEHPFGIGLRGGVFAERREQTFDGPIVIVAKELRTALCVHGQMAMRINKAGQEHAFLEVDFGGSLRSEGPEFRQRTHGLNGFFADADGFGGGVFVVHCEDFRAGDDRMRLREHGVVPC